MPEKAREAHDIHAQVDDLVASKWPKGFGTSQESYGKGRVFLFSPGGSVDWSNYVYRIASARADIGTPGSADELSELTQEIRKLADGLQSLKEAVETLRDELNDRPIRVQTQLLDIGDKYEVVHAIPIVIEESDNEVIASFPEVEVFAVGSSEPEAISNLKTAIADLYCELVETPRDELGRLPLSWLRVFEKVIRKVGNTQ